MKFWWLVACCQIILTSIQAQNTKYEFRGAWVATIANIDWPSSSKAGAEQQQYELIQLFDKFKACGLNAVILQVRPSAELIYPSQYEPWSRYITGAQGQPPYPYYDPLEFAIQEAHKRGMELHAWFNPYRALTNIAKNPNPSNHITYIHPEWFLNYGGKKYFDPGLPQVRQYVTDIVMEVVNKYDIDAVHFDDYFYPYRIAGKEFPDHMSYARYGYNYSDKGDWRRENVNIFVQEINSAIKKSKPLVRLGISPFGVWRNAYKDPLGSATNGGQTNYDDLYADVRLWLQNGWIDYIMPQLYWERGHKAADFDVLLNWWSNNSFGRACYIGHGLYQLGTNKNPAWRSTNNLTEQIDLVRNTNNINGSCYYSANGFIKNTYGFVDLLQYDLNRKKAFIPPMPWLDSIAPIKPDVQYVRLQNGIIKLVLKHNSKDANRFLIYKFNTNEKVNIKTTDNLIDITTSPFWQSPANSTSYKYVVTSMDKLNNESLPYIVEIKN